jgi:hypothetical protein
MKKIFFVLLSLGFYAATAQTADEIIQKYTAAMGGLDAFNKIKTAIFTASFEAQGNELPMTIRTINGRATRTDLDVMGKTVIRCYKDGKAWTQNPMAGINSPKEVTGNELNDFKVQSMLASPLMAYKEREHKVELVGQEDVEGIKTFKIKLTSKDDNRVTNYYISTTDYTLIKSDTERDIQGQKTTVETSYSDLKEFNGAKIFMTRSQKINGQVFQTTRYTKLELDTTIDEKIFDMPK